MLNQNTAHAKHPTTTPLRALKSSDCKKHGCQLLLNLCSGLVPAWTQQSLTPIRLIIRESAMAGGVIIFLFQNDCGPRSATFLITCRNCGPFVLAADALVISTAW